MNDFISSLFPIVLTTLAIMVPVSVLYFLYKWMKASLALKQEQTELLEEILSVLKEKKE